MAVTRRLQLTLAILKPDLLARPESVKVIMMYLLVYQTKCRPPPYWFYRQPGAMLCLY